MQFHPQCLKDDKRRRVRQKRAAEQLRFRLWLRKIRCDHCGLAVASHVAPLRADTESPCEASRYPQSDVLTAKEAHAQSSSISSQRD